MDVAPSNSLELIFGVFKPLGIAATMDEVMWTNAGMDSGKPTIPRSCIEVAR
jgi:hypothetical protein